MGLRDPDYLDVSLQGNRRRLHRGIGIYFAPSPHLLYPFLTKRKHRGLTDADWAAYAEAYRNEMRQSYRDHRSAWLELLSWQRVILLCFCTDPEQCHRRVLAEILVKLGAEDRGEYKNAGPAPA
jgi:hypothetical protein